MPLVSVVVPTRNRPEMLAEALASVRAQTFTDYEIIVVSNGESRLSRGESRAAASAHGARYFALRRGNISAARNHGVAQASGEWIAFLDDDDIWVPHKMTLQLEEARRTAADMVSSDYVKFHPDEPDTLFRPRPPAGWTYHKAASHIRWWANPSATIVRKSVLDQLGGFDPRQRFTEDGELWRRLAWRHRIVQLDEVLMRYRQGHPSAMQRVRERDLYELRMFIKMQFDTPSDLRHELPSFSEFALPRLLIFVPKFIHQPFHPNRLRRHWLRLLTRLGLWSPIVRGRP